MLRSASADRQINHHIEMRGKVLVEEELQGKPTNTFVERYFVSFPFCGVRWFKLEPELSSSTDEQLLHRSDSSCGWVYGGNVFPVAVAALDTIEYQLQDWYAFKLTLKSGEHVRDFRLACRYVTERTAWIVDSESALQAQHFVKAFSEHDTLPLPELLSCLVAEDNDLRLNNYWLTNSILQSINGFFRGLYPEGSILQGLFMQNCQLGDSQVPLVCAVIANLPYINKLSLSENIITSEGCTVLCETLNKTKYLGLLDLSNNYLDDDCAEGLAKCLARLPDLNSLNLSRNQFTNESTKPFFLKLGKHSSALISIDFSYNIMGDEVASLVAILLYIRPSQVRSVNLSFCGVGDLGVKELSDALPSCSTLENLHLAGTYIKHRTLQILVEAIGKHHSSYTKKGQEGLHVSLGGILQDHDKALTLSYRSLRYALPYVGESTLVKSATLRKRLFQGSYGLDQSQDFCSDAINQDYPIICIRVLFPDSIDSPEELLEALALSLSLDTCQFRLLSSKKIVGDSPKLHFIVFTLELVPETRKFQIQSSSKYSDSLHGFNDRDQGWRPLKELSNLSVVLRLMHEMAIQSHPLLRMLGIRTVYLQYSEVNADGEGNSVTTENLVIEGASSGGKGLLDGYLPTLAPNEILEDDVDQEEEQEDDIWNMEEDVTDVPLGKDGLVEEETDEARLRSNQLAIQQRETQRRNFRMENERMILAVRQLYRDGLVNGSVAKFWEGAFGHLKYREHTRKILQHVIDPVSEVYIGVRKRQLLCEAMLQRDLPTLTYLIDSAIANCEENQLGVTFIYAQRLQSEIQSLIRRFKDLEVLATSYEELNTVEEYLLACGRSAYSGPEMFLAVDLRQQLVASAASKGISSLQDDLTYIQTRALFSNLLISRDMDTLRARIDDLKYSSEEQLLLLPETFTAQTMLRDFDNTLVELQQAMIAKDIDRLCDTVAFAAYSYIYDDVVQEAHAAIVSLSKNPAKLLEPIVAGLRENSKQKIDKAFEFCKRMGVKHEAIESRVCAGIFVAKSKIFDVSITCSNYTLE